MYRKKSLKPKDLVALAVSLDGDFVQLGLGDDGDLGVECDARKKAVTSKDKW